MGLIVESQPYYTLWRHVCRTECYTSANIESLIIRHECRADPPTFKTLRIRDVDVACCLARALLFSNKATTYFIHSTMILNIINITLHYQSLTFPINVNVAKRHEIASTAANYI